MQNGSSFRQKKSGQPGTSIIEGNYTEKILITLGVFHRPGSAPPLYQYHCVGHHIYIFNIKLMAGNREPMIDLPGLLPEKNSVLPLCLFQAKSFEVI